MQGKGIEVLGKVFSPLREDLIPRTGKPPFPEQGMTPSPQRGNRNVLRIGTNSIQKYPKTLNRPGFLRAEPLSSARKMVGVIGGGK